MTNAYSHNTRRQGSSTRRPYPSQPRIEARDVKAVVNPSEFYHRQFPGWTPKRDRGWVTGPLCPAHNDRQPGSFVVNLTTGAAVCFSCGFKAGDVIAFTMHQQGLSFPDALRSLAAEWRVA